MSYRITTNGLFRTYGTAMRSSNQKIYKDLDRVQTQRTFSSFAEDPASASKAFRLRRDYWRTDDYIDTSNYLISKYELAYTSAGAIVNGDETHPSLNGLASSLAGISDASAASRRALGNDLIAKADSIALAMNVRYSEEFVFAGADGLNAPFLWDGDTLLYRGVDVSAKEGSEDFERLRHMADETTYVDIGLGMEENEDGSIKPNSAFNSSISGLNFLGYGNDEDGYPNNMAVLMKQLGNIFASADPDTGEFQYSTDAEDARVLSQKLHDAINRVIDNHVELSADSSYIRLNLNQLETEQVTLSEEITDVEQTDMALAITQMMWAQYSYQAALRVGNELLSQSLFDYMH